MTPQQKAIVERFDKRILILKGVRRLPNVFVRMLQAKKDISVEVKAKTTSKIITLIQSKK